MTTDNELIQAIDQALDERSLAWAAKWIEDSLQGETNERVIEFGRNMAMTLRAAVNGPASAAPVVDNNDLISRAEAKAAMCNMCANQDRYKPAEPLEGSMRLFHFQRSDNWNAGQCLAQAIDSVPATAATAAPQPQSRSMIGSSRHPHFTAEDHQRMKEALDALSDNPTEEEAEAVLRACGTSGKEVVNEFIDRLLKENLELKNKLATAAPVEQSDETLKDCPNGCDQYRQKQSDSYCASCGEQLETTEGAR